MSIWKWLLITGSELAKNIVHILVKTWYYIEYYTMRLMYYYFTISCVQFWMTKIINIIIKIYNIIVVLFFNSRNKLKCITKK